MSDGYFLYVAVHFLLLSPNQSKTFSFNFKSLT